MGKASAVDAIRRFLWKNFGATLNRRTLFALGLVLLMLLCCMLFVLTQNSFIRFLAVLTTSVGSIFLLGSSSSLIAWTLSDKKGRKQIEEEVALKQLKSRARDKHFQH